MGPRLQVVGRTPRPEERLRRAWTGRPGPVLRAAGALFGLAAETRNLLYETGVLPCRPAPLPVISVGGLTVGGGGKTPLAAAVAGWLLAAGRRPAVLTRGFADELRVHRVLTPGAVVLGAPSRLRAAEAAARRGAHVAVLDDGFQHRRLARELDLLLVDADALIRTNRRRFPAGPFREPLGAASRADALVVTRRSDREPSARRLAERLARRLGGRPVARCALLPGELVAANAEAAARRTPDPAVAVTGIMKPRLFLEALGRRWPRVEGAYTFRDHRGPDPGELAAILREAGDRGIVGTLKDAVGLAPRCARVPLWYLSERLAWEEGEEAIRELVVRTAERGRDRRRGERTTRCRPGRSVPGSLAR